MSVKELGRQVGTAVREHGARRHGGMREGLMLAVGSQFKIPLNSALSGLLSPVSFRGKGYILGISR